MPVTCGWCGELQVAVRVLFGPPPLRTLVRCRSCTINHQLLADLVDARSGAVPRRPGRSPRTPAPVDRRTCVSSKVFYRNESAAWAGLSAWRKHRRPGQARGQIYDCSWCPGWHLTSGKTRHHQKS